MAQLIKGILFSPALFNAYNPSNIINNGPTKFYSGPTFSSSISRKTGLVPSLPFRKLNFMLAILKATN